MYKLILTDLDGTLLNDEKNVSIKYSLKEKSFKNSVLTYQNYIPTLVSDEKLAFDHVEIIIEAMKKLRAGFDYSDNMFCLVPATFTMAELRATYRAVMGQDIYKASLKRLVEHKIVETGNVKKSDLASGRQSTEFTYVGGN